MSDAVLQIKSQAERAMSSAGLYLRRNVHKGCFLSPSRGRKSAIDRCGGFDDSRAFTDFLHVSPESRAQLSFGFVEYI